MAYLLGTCIGYGGNSAFFHLRGHDHIGVLVSMEGYTKGLKRDLKLGRLFRSLGLPVPRYLKMIKVKVPEYFEKTIDRWCKIGGGSTHYILKKFKPNSVHWGLAIEIVEQDLTLISSHRLNHIYKKECSKFEDLGIEIHDSGLEHNVLWSPHKKKMYFIDFDMWDVPDELFQKKGIGSWLMQPFRR